MPRLLAALALVALVCASLWLPSAAAASLSAQLALLRSSHPAPATPATPARLADGVTACWASRQPVGVVYAAGSLFSLYAAASNGSGVVQLSDSGEVRAQQPLLSADATPSRLSLAASNRSLFALGAGSIAVLALSDLSLSRRLAAPQSDAGVLLGADAAGTTLLWSALQGQSALTLDAETGNVTGTFTGGGSGRLQVAAGVLHPSNGQILLADDASHSLLLVDRSNALLYTAPYADEQQACLGLTISASGDDVYGVFAPAVLPTCVPSAPLFYTLAHIDFASGKVKSRASLACSSHPLGHSNLSSILSAGAAAGELYFVNPLNGTINRFAVDTNRTEASFFLTPYPFNSRPAAIASEPSYERLALAQGADSFSSLGYYIVNASSGQQVGEAVDLSPYANCSSGGNVTDLSVSRRAVYAAPCGTSIVVMTLLPNGTSVWLRTIPIVNDTVVSLVVDELRSVLYYVTANLPAQISKTDLSGKLNRILTGYSDAFADIAVDSVNDGTVWAITSDTGGYSLLYTWKPDGQPRSSPLSDLAHLYHADAQPSSLSHPPLVHVRVTVQARAAASSTCRRSSPFSSLTSRSIGTAGGWRWLVSSSESPPACLR